jgi:succinate dehydrogenase/fumarate reductase flavoprotein subunit
MRERITRREALKRGAAGVAGLTLTGAVLGAGCAGGEAAGDDDVTPGDSVAAGNGDTAADGAPDRTTDLLIIGTGLAGLWAAVAARDAGVARVTLMDKGAFGRSSMSATCAGATIYLEPGDDRDAWLRAAAEAVGFLCPQDHVADLLDRSHPRLERLAAWGVSYPGTRMASRGLGEMKMRVSPTWADGARLRSGGEALVGALRQQVKARDVEVLSKTFVTGLLTHEGRAAGAVGFHQLSGETVAIQARAVILATADCSFRGHYACVKPVTGDGFALAYQAGARLRNMEFLASNTGPPGYGFEGTGVSALFGARFRNASGEAFMARYHPDADQAEVCHIVQAMDAERRAGQGPPFTFDMTTETAPTLALIWENASGYMALNHQRLLEAGVDLDGEPQPWGPSIQTLRGGVATDVGGMSDLPGLFAAGMTRSLMPGIFNGWSTLRAMGSGEAAGEAAAAFLADAEDPGLDTDQVREARAAALAPLSRAAGADAEALYAGLEGALFGARVSIVKDAQALDTALATVTTLAADAEELMAEDLHGLRRAHETRHMLQVADLYLRASRARQETRADHARAEHPERDDQGWLRWIDLQRGDDGAPRQSLEEVPLGSYPVQPAT